MEGNDCCEGTTGEACDNAFCEYEITPDVVAKLENTFTYHTPKPGQPEKYGMLREKAKELAIMICRMTPPSREQSLALTHLEDVVYCSNAAIARNE